MSLSSNIKKYRELKKLTVEDLAEKLEVSRQSVYDWEDRGITPRKNKLYKIAKVLDVKVTDLYDEGERQLVDNDVNLTENMEEENISRGTVYQDIVEKNTEYLLVPRKIILEKYELLSNNRVEQDKKKMEEESKTADTMRNTIATLLATQQKLLEQIQNLESQIFQMKQAQ